MRTQSNQRGTGIIIFTNCGSCRNCRRSKRGLIITQPVVIRVVLCAIDDYHTIVDFRSCHTTTTDSTYDVRRVAGDVAHNGSSCCVPWWGGSACGCRSNVFDTLNIKRS